MISEVLTSMMNIRCKEDYLNKDFHFRNMHIYVNPDFGEYSNEMTKCATELDEEGESKSNKFKLNDHIHFYFWNINVSEMNLFAMTSFIRMVNYYTKKPVYIHLPREAGRTKFYMSTALNTYNEINRIKLAYIFIIEKSTYISNYAYDWPLRYSYAEKYGTKYDYHLCIRWDRMEFARPYYQRVSNNEIKEIIKL